MERIEFEENKDFQMLKEKAYNAPAAKQGFFLKLLAKSGVDDRATANLILLAIVVVAFSMTFYLYSETFKRKSFQSSPEETRAQIRLLLSEPSRR